MGLIVSCTLFIESTSDDYKHGCNQGNRVGVGEKITAEEEGQVKAQETSNQKETGQLPDQIKTVVSNEEKPNEDVLSEKVELDANLDQRQAGSHDNPKEQDKAAANPEQLSQVVANPDQLRQAAADPRSFGQAAASPMQFRQVANNHQPFGQAPDNTQSFGQAVIDSKQFGEAAANSQPFGQAAVNSEHFGEAASNPEQAKQVEANPEQSKQAAANPEQLEQVVNPDPLTAAGKQTFAMNLCNCSRTINASNWESEGVRYEQTTCGTEAFRR